MARRQIFWGFFKNWFLMSPLHYHSSRSDFGFQFAEIFVIKKKTPRFRRYGESPTARIIDTGSRQIPASLISGVADSPHHWYAESATPRITNTESRLLHFFKDNTESHGLPAPVIRWVADSPYRWVGESPTPRITDMESRRRVLLSRGRLRSL